MATPGMDVSVLQTALLQVAEATKQAAEAAKQAQAQASQARAASSVGAGAHGSSIDWSKLINKPPIFEHASVEAEIKAFRDWSWQLNQFLSTIDPSYDEELKRLFEDPSKGMDMQSASTDTRTRSSKLYGLLASLVRGKALSLVKSVSGADGYEALRQMILTLRPNTNTRGLALLTAATSWPAFQMNLPLQPQILKLEEVFEDSRRAGTDIQDAVKAAILMRCVSGQLKTYLNLGAQDSMAYNSLREQCMKWDRAQQRWSTLVTTDDTSAPMEVDRIEGKGWHASGGKKRKGKGKSDKGASKGKSKQKGKSKDLQKGKSSKGYDKGKSKGDERSKGKGKGGDRQCYVCGRFGHIAKECWKNPQQVRAIPQVGQQVQDPTSTYQTVVQGSPTSSTTGSFTHLTSVSNQVPHSQAQGAVQATQHRVSRIVENNSEDVVFDLRTSNNGGGNICVVHYYIGDEDDACTNFSGDVRAMIEDVTEQEDLQTILLDSGADASVFPASMINAGVPVEGESSRLCDAQGRPIPLEGSRCVEIRLGTNTGKTVVLREKVAISSKVTQPILCFGHLLEQGFGIDGREQSLVHYGNNINIPLYMQNRSMTVMGHVRVISAAVDGVLPQMVRAVRADVSQDLVNSSVGWSVNSSGYIVGRHLGSGFQDPTLSFPALQGPQYRTTLAKGDDGSWYILELNEPLRMIVQLDASFHEMEGNRSIITLVTEGEKLPGMMGFHFGEDGPVDLQGERFEEEAEDLILAPEDGVQDAGEGEIHQVDPAEQQAEGRVVVQPDKSDEIVVNGESLTVESSLANLRAACSSYGISTSGGKAKIFRRLKEHQINLQMQTVIHASRDAMEAELREPRAPTLTEPPDERAQAQHRLTHVPYQPWCESCVAHRARSDQHHRDGSSAQGSTPVISFDFFYTRASGEVEDDSSLIAMAMVDNKTGYLGVVPLNSKAQFDLLTKELVAFCSTLGYNEVELRCDNEPAIMQVAKLTIQARQQMGLVTRLVTPAAYAHCNGLIENAVARIRGVGCSFMHSLQNRLKVQFGSGHALWTWAMRHAAWTINRYSPYRGMTSYEVVFGKPYEGLTCEYGEPIFGFIRSKYKGNPKWERMIYLGKVENQDSFLLYNGTSLLLTRSVRRINTDWRTHMKFHLNLNLHSWQYKVGFGSRVVPTKKRGVAPRGVSFAAPLGDVAPSALVDEEAEAVKKKAQEEKQEEHETAQMSGHDRRDKVELQVVFGDEQVFQEETSKHAAPATPAPEVMDVQTSSSSSARPTDPGLAAPVTPTDDVIFKGPDSPRHTPTTRTHGPDDDGDGHKRARVEDHKKQKINALRLDQEHMVRVVKFGDAEHHTMDDYGTDFNDDLQEEDEQDVWKDEQEIHFAGVDESLWSDNSLEETPADPEPWVDELADKLEISRLLEMGVLKRLEEHEGEVFGKLTTKFVRDWRIKLFVGDGDSRLRWMRRSRYVAREFAVDRRDDTFSPATGCHTNNVLPVVYLKQMSDAKDQPMAYQPLLAALDIGDAFLQVPQDKPLKVILHGQAYAVLRNLPGQRLGAKAWYWFFRKFLEEKLNYEFCTEQPCLGRNGQSVILLHVDDMLFCGNSIFFHKEFLPMCQSKFPVKWSCLEKEGSSISFLKKKICMVEKGLMVIPGTQTAKLVERFEEHFGKVRVQTVPCDASIQLEDASSELEPSDASWYRSIVGMCLYLSRDRPDIMFTVKEVAARMSKPTLTGLQHLRKLVGYLKHTGELGIFLQCPSPGQGKVKFCPSKFWVLETYSDADWASNKQHRRSTSCGVHVLNGCYLFGSARTQRVIALSSCESELYSIVSTMSDAIYIKRCLQFALQMDVHQVHFTDSSSARQLCNRQGCGKIRHLSGKILWVQDVVRLQQVELTQIPTAFNLSDIGTKSLSRKRLFALMSDLGMVYVETGEAVGQVEADESHSKHSTARDVSRLAKTILQLTAVLGLGPTGANGMEQNEQCRDPVQDGGNDMTWIWISIIILTLLWIGFAVTAWTMWRRLMVRMGHDELQQAETDTFTGHTIERLNRYEREFNDLQTSFNNYVVQTDREMSMLEDYIDSVKDGLILHGGFTRYITLTAAQRQEMTNREQGNHTLWRARQRNPDDTDEPIARPMGAVANASNPGGAASSSAAAPRAPRASNGEEGEEDQATTDEEMEDVDDMDQVNPDTPEGHLTRLVDHLRRQINEALAFEHFEDAAEMQVTLDAVLQSAEGDRPELTMELARRVMACFNRLFRRARNRGEVMLSHVYREFAENLDRYI